MVISCTVWFSIHLFSAMKSPIVVLLVVLLVVGVTTVPIGQAPPSQGEQILVYWSPVVKYYIIIADIAHPPEEEHHARKPRLAAVFTFPMDTTFPLR